MSRSQRLHIWFSDGWQLHIFQDLGSAVVISPFPNSKSYQLDSPEAVPYVAALSLNSKLVTLCEEVFGRAPWEITGKPRRTGGALPQVSRTLVGDPA
ncbi:MAG: hypothetical protein KQJ78_01680 [Deltaproteobacteria bacterium]|nr:hypothetical protein [Deltaproteobacteria bacterium]